MDRNYWPLFWNTFILGRPGLADFADVIKIATTFIKTTLKDSKKIQRIRHYLFKCNLYLYFFISQELLISCEKMLMSAELKGCVAWFIYFLDLLQARYNCAKFHHCGLCVINFRVGSHFIFPPSVGSSENTHPELG